MCHCSPCFPFYSAVLINAQGDTHVSVLTCLISLSALLVLCSISGDFPGAPDGSFMGRFMWPPPPPSVSQQFDLCEVEYTSVLTSVWCADSGERSLIITLDHWRIIIVNKIPWKRLRSPKPDISSSSVPRSPIVVQKLLKTQMSHRVGPGDMFPRYHEHTHTHTHTHTLGVYSLGPTCTTLLL